MEPSFLKKLLGIGVWVLVAGCVGLPPTPPKKAKNSVFKPSRHAFLKVYSRFLENPSSSSLNSVREYIKSPDGEGDKYLLSYRSQRKFAGKYFKKILSNIDKGDTYTVRSLLYLAFDLSQPNLAAESRTISSEIMNVERGRHARTVRSASYLLGVHIPYNFPNLLIKSLAEEFKDTTEKRRKIYLQGVANFGLEDDQFRPLCPNCPSQPVTFFEAKYKKLSKAVVSDPKEVKIQEWLRRTYLARTTAPPVLQIRKLLFEPHDRRIQELKDACYYKSDPAADKPTINDLGEMVSKKIVEGLNEGSLDISRALIIVADERCWKEIDEIDGPRPWLSTILICRQPETFLQAAALENPGGLFLDEIMKFDSPQGWMNCTGQPLGSGSLAAYRIQKLKAANAVTPMERRIMQYLVKHFDTTTTEFTEDRTPAQQPESPRSTEPK